MNSLSVKAKFQLGQFKRLKQIFCKFEGQFDLEGQGQINSVLALPKVGHMQKFCELRSTIRYQIYFCELRSTIRYQIYKKINKNQDIA